VATLSTVGDVRKLGVALRAISTDVVKESPLRWETRIFSCNESEATVAAAAAEEEVTENVRRPRSL